VCLKHAFAGRGVPAASTGRPDAHADQPVGDLPQRHARVAQRPHHRGEFPGEGVGHLGARLAAFPPTVLRLMARYWNSHLAELDGATAAETRPDGRAAFAFERLCVQGILAGLDDRPGAS
jgi:hypothetical protein